MSDNGNRDAVQWGPEIVVDGKRPEWLKDDDRFCYFHNEANYWVNDTKAEDWEEPIGGFRWVTAIRLPADHPHYKRAPTIDWTAPIEVFTNGAWELARIEQHDTGARERFPYCLAYGRYAGQWFTADGKHCNDGDYVRNIPQSRQRTTDEQLTHYAERCKALVERMAAKPCVIGWVDYEEARAIVASMVEVDGDVLIARELRLEEVGEHASFGYKNYMNGGHYDNDEDVLKFVRAIRRGRALERGE